MKEGIIIISQHIIIPIIMFGKISIEIDILLQISKKRLDTTYIPKE